jgi:uncharacterized protein (UPF0332 family)
MDWKECINKKIARSAVADAELVKSLTKISENKLSSAKLLDLNEITYASKLSLCYDSLRELLEALAVKKGYKIYNHECYIGFLKEVINNSALAQIFDRLRLLRNSINYYGQSLSIKDAKMEIASIIELRKEVHKLLTNL